MPGVSRPALGAPTFPGATRMWTAPPACLTCDDMLVSADVDVQAKFKCLDDRLAAATGDLQLALAARLELMYQQYGTG